MANVKNYVLLETITVGAAGASSVTFNNIPQTGYTDLKIVMSVRANNVAANTGNYTAIGYQFNAATSGYSTRYIYGSGSSAGSGTDTTTTIGGVVYGRLSNSGMNNASSTANTFTSIEMYIPNYTSSNQKSFSVDATEEQNQTANWTEMMANLWTGTAAITSITFAAGGTSSFVQYSTFSLYGIAAVGTTPTVAPYAAGGDIIQTDGTYWYHAFLSSGTFTPAKALSADVLVIAGGGGGGNNNRFCGGGGAGGLLAFTSQSLSTTNHTVTIGSGGAVTTNGNDSQFGALTLVKGGGAGSNGAGATGGSGAGGGLSAAGGSATSGQGYAGGNGTSSAGQRTAGGGGGASAVGQNNSNTYGGAGGAGSSTYSSWGSVTGTGQNVSGTYYFAGGGGGSAYEYYDGVIDAGAGGSGGGGKGGRYATSSGSTFNAIAGIANTGGGGGGAAWPGAGSDGAAGGSGIVIVRYAI